MDITVNHFNPYVGLLKVILCPWSPQPDVPGMVSLCPRWTLMTEQDPLFPIPTAFVDNWEILHNNVEDLCLAQQKSCHVCGMWK